MRGMRPTTSRVSGKAFMFKISYLDRSSIICSSSFAPQSRSHMLERDVCLDCHDRIVRLGISWILLKDFML